MKYILTVFICFITITLFSQTLKLKKRPPGAMNGLEFAESISDSLLTLDEKEHRIFREFMSGNVPEFFRRLIEISDSTEITGQIYKISYFVTPDYALIGTDSNYFYCPMRPQLAQKIAEKLNCSLPTRKIADQIYKNAPVKLVPQPIPPSPAMVTVPVFLRHNKMVLEQRSESLAEFPLGSLVAGTKKDVVISDKIRNDKGQIRVVIYGWHKPDGKAIQPLYNGHNTEHVDYSHGIRFVQKKVWVNGRSTTVQRVLRSPEFNVLLSDEGTITERY